MKTKTKLNLLLLPGAAGLLWAGVLLWRLGAPDWTWLVTLPAMGAIVMGGWALNEKQHIRLWHRTSAWHLPVKFEAGPVQRRKD